MKQNAQQRTWPNESPIGATRAVERWLLMVSSNTLPIKTAGAIAGIINDGESSVDVQAIGADAVNRATKAVAIAMGRLKEDGLPTACNIVFQDVVIQGERKTAMRWTVFVI